MFTEEHKRRFIMLPVLACMALAGCGEDKGAAHEGDDASVKGQDASGNVDASVDERDASVDEPDDKDPGTDAGARCTGGETLAIVGNYVAADGTKHWLRKSPTATTYSRIPAGAPDATKPPVLAKVTRVCYDQKSFVGALEGSRFVRVDWVPASNQTGAQVSLCVSNDVASEAAALALPAATPGSASGCNGGAWQTLTQSFGGK